MQIAGLGIVIGAAIASWGFGMLGAAVVVVGVVSLFISPTAVKKWSNAALGMLSPIFIFKEGLPANGSVAGMQGQFACGRPRTPL